MLSFDSDCDSVLLDGKQAAIKSVKEYVPGAAHAGPKS